MEFGVGVLIAFAADGWREDLQQVQEERLYLDRLSEDDATPVSVGASWSGRGFGLASGFTGR